MAGTHPLPSPWTRRTWRRPPAGPRWSAPHVSTLKIGLELYLRYGPDVVASVRGASGVEIFLDLKLHDIPATVAGAARAVARLRPALLTVHAAAGPAAIRAAADAAPDARIVAVTVLTSLGEADLARIGLAGPVSEAVAAAGRARGRGGRGRPGLLAAGGRGRPRGGRRRRAARHAGRPAGAVPTSNDQARVATPEEALRSGADLLVIGRPITGAADPGAAAAAIAASLRRAEAVRPSAAVSSRTECALEGGRTWPIILIGGYRGIDSASLGRTMCHSAMCRRKTKNLALPAKMQLLWVCALVRGVILDNLCRCKREFTLPSRA